MLAKNPICNSVEFAGETRRRQNDPPRLSQGAKLNPDKRAALALVPPQHGRAAKVPQYRIHKAKNLGYVRLDGRMIYLGRANTPESLAEYRRVVAEWLACGRIRKRFKPATLRLVSEIVDSFLKWARTYYIDATGNPSAGIGSVESAGKVLNQLYGETAGEDFGPLALKAVRHALSHFVVDDQAREKRSRFGRCQMKMLRPFFPFYRQPLRPW